jgi:nitroimidazol reductase NimA-like FMN-containing flavoprotein (pyridoxamine 5'-phosphate oxidase superfamily)
MRDLSSNEINELLDHCDWGTLLLIDEDKPYGIEVSHFIHENALYFIINPEGKAASCIKKNPNAAYKVCKADLPRQKWSAATVRGVIERVTDPQKIYESFIMLAKRLNRDREKYTMLGKKFSQNPEKTPVHCLPIKNISGRASP